MSPTRWIGSASLLLATFAFACHKPEDAHLGETTTLTGKIDSWTEGGGYSVQPAVFSLGPTRPLSTAAVDEGGSFRIDLPGGEVLSYSTE